jgi:ankyrin repeat protein
MEKDDFDIDSTELDLSVVNSECEGDDDTYMQDNDLTQLQEDIIYAIETFNKALFIDLGGWGSISMDFEVNKKGDFPLGIACGRSSAEVALLLLENPTVDLQRVDKIGANWFWLACEGDKYEILPLLIDHGINYLIKTTDGRNGLHVATQK